MSNRQGMRRNLGIALALVLVTVLAYAPVLQNGFVSFDDNVYVTRNAQVQAGLSAEGFAWAFNVGHASNWHPLAWLSHMLDVSLWGLDPFGHHLTSLVLHAASVVVLFFLLLRMTGATGKSAFVAAAFAVHPLHVESVAWVAERKDVLSALLGLLSIGVWVGWTKERGTGRYVASVLLYALALMAKPMLVTLPFVLLLLDFWPLRRLAWRSILEKIPFFTLAILSCAVTVMAQRELAVISSTVLPLPFRLGNGVLALVAYLGKALWPTRLAFFYPYPPMISQNEVLLGAALLLAATAFLVLRARKLPAPAVGWLIWLGMLVPVIGVVQVGRQAMADRYMYLPLVGLAIAAAWGVEAILPRNAIARGARAAIAVAAVGAWIVLTRAQVAVWKDDLSLFGHAVAVTEDNAVAHDLLGTALADRGRLAESEREYRRAVELAPRNVEFHTNLGILLGLQERFEEALASYRTAIELDPTYGNAFLNRGVTLANLGRLDEAIESLTEGIRLRPDRADAVTLLEELRRARGPK